MHRIRNLSEDIRRETTVLNNLLKDSGGVTKCYQRILLTHSEIWSITGQVLCSIVKLKKSRDAVTVVPGKTVHIVESLSECVPPWTEIMERIGTEIPEHPRSRKKKAKNFSSLKLRKMLKFDHKGRCVNAFQLATSVDFLKLGYDIIKSKPGNMVRGSDKQTLDGLPLIWFEETSKALTEESYVFKPARRVYIPKPNGKKIPLGISSPALPPPPHRQVKGVRGERNALSG